MAGLGKTERLRQQAIASLITQSSVALASQQCGVSERSLARWIKEPEFAAELKAARNQLLQSAIDRLKSSALQAVATLVEIAGNPASSESARVSAAKALIDYALRVGAIEDLVDRIEQLERNVGNESTNRFEELAKTIDATSGGGWTANYQVPDARWNDRDDSEEDVHDSVQRDLARQILGCFIHHSEFRAGQQWRCFS